MQSMPEAETQKWYYDRKANATSLEQGDLVLSKANAYRGGRKVKDQLEEELYEVECQFAEGIPSDLMKNTWTGTHRSSTKIIFFSSLQQRELISIHLCK